MRALRHLLHIRRTHGVCPALLPAAHCMPHAQLVTRYSPHLRTSPHRRTSHALTCALRWQPPLAPPHTVHLRLAATHTCPPLHVARGRVRAWGLSGLSPPHMCVPHTLYACARPPRTPRVSHAPRRSPYACATMQALRAVHARMLTPVRRGVRCAASCRRTRRPSYACPAAAHPWTGRCRGACVHSPHGAGRAALPPAAARAALRCYPPPHAPHIVRVPRRCARR